MEGNEKECQTQGKSEGPLTVRIDPYYKDKFNEIVENSTYSKKEMLELIISSYIYQKDEKERESILSFQNEINLISDSLNGIFNTFKKIAIKGQDTIASERSLYEQQNKNYELSSKELQLKINELQDKLSTLQTINNSYFIEKENYLKNINDLEKKNKDYEDNQKNIKLQNAELLEQLNKNRLVEKENLSLIHRNEDLIKENNKLKLTLEEKDFEINMLKNKVVQFENEINDLINNNKIHIKDITNKYDLELKNLKEKNEASVNKAVDTIKKELELDKKSEILKLKEEYNKLQIENIKNLNAINKLSEEIFTLKRV